MTTEREEHVASEWQVGDVILDLYEVKDIHEGGAMGVVYRVRHRGWDMDLAVKSPRPNYFATEEQKENFVRECETWINLGLHPHTVSCHYVRTLGGIPRVFAEYIEGGSLLDWIKSGRLYSGGQAGALERIIDVAILFAWGLEYSHEQGLIHQDVKPGNVMMTPDGVAKVTDFGLAQAQPVREVELADSEGGTVLVKGRSGTPAYWSPEQAAEGEKLLSRKTDIWSWGLSLLEMFAGERTWNRGEAAPEVLESFVGQEEEVQGIPRMPAGVVALLRECFRRNPAERLRRMGEVVSRLREVYREVTGGEYPRQRPKAAQLLADSLNNRALSLLDLDKGDEADGFWQAALEADPHHPEATYNRGVELWRRSRLADDALVQQLEAVRASHGARWTDELLLALVHLERADPDSARSLLEEAVRQAPGEAELQTALAAARSADLGLVRRSETYLGHSGPLSSACFSPDNRWALSSSEDHSLRLWELATGRCICTFEGYRPLTDDDIYNDYTLRYRLPPPPWTRGHTSSVLSVCFAPGGRHAWSGSSDNTAKLWQVETGKCIATLEHPDGVTAVSASPDGRFMLSGCDDHGVRLWDGNSGDCRLLEGHSDEVTSVCVSSDGRRALSGSKDGTLRLWDLESKLCCRVFEEHDGGVHAVALVSDGRSALSGGDDKTLRLWDLESGCCLDRYGGHVDAVRSISVATDGLRALSSGGDARLWEIPTGRCLRTLDQDGTRVRVHSAALADDGRTALLAQGKALQLWKLPQHFPAVCRPHVSRLRTAAEATEAEARVDELLRFSEVALEEHRLEAAIASVRQAREQPGYARAPKCMAAWVRLYPLCRRTRLRAGWPVRDLKGHEKKVSAVALSPDGQLALSASEDRTLRLWQPQTGDCVRTFEGHQRRVRSVCFSPDGRWALSGSWDLKMRLWEVATGRCVRTFEGHEQSVESVCFSPDSRTALSADGAEFSTTHGGQLVRLWDVKSGRCLLTLEGHQKGVKSVCFSADGRRALSGGRDSALHLWELGSGRSVARFETAKPVTSVALSPDGRKALAAGGSEGGVEVWDVIDGLRLRTLKVHGHVVESLALSADGRFLCTGSVDKSVRLTDLEGKPNPLPRARRSGWSVLAPACVLERHSGPVRSVALSADGRWVLSGGEDNSVRLWELDWELEPTPA